MLQIGPLHPLRYRLAASLSVRGSIRVPSAVLNQPLKSMHQTSFGLAQAANGWE